MILPVLNKVFIVLPSAMQEGKKEGDKTIYFASNDIEMYGSNEGTLHSRGATSDLPYRIGDIAHQVENGDHILINYKVVAGFTRKPNGTVIYNNTFTIGGEQVWRCNDSDILAVKKGENWYGVGEWNLINELPEKEEVSEGGIILPESKDKLMLREGMMESSNIIDKGEPVYYQIQYKSVYNLGDRSFIILTNNRVEDGLGIHKLMEAAKAYKHGSIS